MTETNIHQWIQEQINANAIVLFMKGTANIPQCGFSATVVAILQKLGLAFKDINVLTSPELRQGIKDFTQWPTIPQLYIKGEFIGGCDIVKEMYQNGELQELLQKQGIMVA